MRRTTALLAVALVLAAACGSGDEAAPAVTSAPSTSVSPTTVPATTITVGPTTTTTPGCNGEPAAAGPIPSTIQHGGFEREYVIHVPRGHDRVTPAPLVFNLHAFALNIEYADNNGLAEEADGRGWFVVTPQGLPTDASPTDSSDDGDERADELQGLPAWNVLGVAGTSGPDDVGFIDALIDEMVSTYCVDESRVYSTGLSNGAGMSNTLACELSDRIAAIVPVAGVNLSSFCSDTTPVPVLAIHGDADTLVPMEGGTLLGFDTGNPSVPDRMSQWATHNGCDPEPALTTDDPVPGVNSTVWSGCDDGADVVLWIIEGWPHAWPRAVTPEDEGRIDATVEAFDFFDQHVRSPAAADDA